MFYKKGALKNFAKFKWKHLYWKSLFKKRPQAQWFSCEFYEIFKTSFFYRTRQVDAFKSILNTFLAA